MIQRFTLVLLAPALTLTPMVSTAAQEPDLTLQSGWNEPPRQARLKAFWWWLNGCVTKEAITSDLEAMKEKGFGGALIFDANGANQRGNDPVPNQAVFASPQWRELFKHALREADRLDLELSLNIQSGWNLGGPLVTKQDASKKVVWSETILHGPAEVADTLPVPASRHDFYRDTAVLAYPMPEPGQSYKASVRVSSHQPGRSATQLSDDNAGTFWVSAGTRPGDGPAPDQPETVQVDFEQAATLDQIRVTPRPGYGPRQCELQVSGDGQTFTLVKAFEVDPTKETAQSFEAVSGRTFRLVIESAFDSGSAAASRNVQIAELKLSGPDATWPRSESGHRPIKHLPYKTLARPLGASAPDTSLLFLEEAAEAGESVCLASEVIDLTDKLDDDGALRWDMPDGHWRVMRFGYTISDSSHVSTASDGWRGYGLDVLDKGAFERYWDAVVAPLIEDAGPLAGNTFKYLHTDSWENEPLNWSADILTEFKQRRGYDPLPWLPVLAGRIVQDRNQSNRFLHDFRRTIGDLSIDNHYQVFRKRAHAHGLQIHPESGGPHCVPIDAQQCLGLSDMPMSEFWAISPHRVGDSNRFFVKQPASASHVHGRKLVAAEGMTTVGPHWQENLWNNLKPAFDQACCEGLNVLYWHAFVCSPKEYGIPGNQYFAGTHLNPNVTWWDKSQSFFDYINRCQFMLQRGMFVADVLYYYGDHIPNFAQHKQSDPAGVMPGFDYDVIDAAALLTRLRVVDGRIVLPDGMNYRVLALPDQESVSLPVLQKIEELVQAGATVVGPLPTRSNSLTWTDEEVRAISDRLATRDRVVTKKTTREALIALGLAPDFECQTDPKRQDVDCIHRRDGDTDIYFVSKRSAETETLTCSFRVDGKVPELWDSVSGHRRTVTDYTQADGQTHLSIEFPPYGSWFVVFRDARSKEVLPVHRPTKFQTLETIDGPWQVNFDPAWGGPRETTFGQLVDWTSSDNPGIRFYSGTATYRTTVEVPSTSDEVWLDLGRVHELAEVRVNGKSCGVVWSPPFRVNLSDAVKPGTNQIEIEVVNFWPNRIIGDDALPVTQRLTKTNIRKLTRDTELMPSGLLGPVRLQAVSR